MRLSSCADLFQILPVSLSLSLITLFISYVLHLFIFVSSSAMVSVLRARFTLSFGFNGTLPLHSCNGSIVNNSDTTGSYAANEVALNMSVFGVELAEQCREICCNTPGCARWTATDPQPGDISHICWLKRSDGALVPNGCAHYGSGHCWSGEVRCCWLGSWPGLVPFLA